MGRLLQTWLYGRIFAQLRWYGGRPTPSRQAPTAGLTGLAPMARNSGRTKGRRFIRGGRAGLRQVLYMPALVATRFNPELRTKYQVFLAAGKPSKLAITAVMRKLLLLANALLRDKRAWKPKLA